MVSASQKTYTVEDIYNLPEGQRAELIDGQIYMMAPPNTRHQEIVFSLSRKIADYIDAREGNCKVYIAPFAVFLTANNRNYVEPDISVVCDKNKIDEKGCNGAPDWILEIVSPGSQHMDYMTKLFKYRSAGVREYWIVDSAKNRILVYNFEQDALSEYTFSDSVPSGIYEDLRIDFTSVN